MAEEKKKREVSFNEDNHIDVKNEFITAKYPEGMKASDLKMLRFIISQCRLGDKEFFEYQFHARDIADHFNMDRHNLYRDAMDMTEKRLFNCNLSIGTEKNHRLIHLFRECRYEDGLFTMQVDEKASELFLKLEKQFTEIPIGPILEMKNKNSIRIYELICKKLMGKYPYTYHAINVEVSIDELRTITETTNQKSYDHTGHFRDKIINPSIAEIEATANWKIIISYKKKGRKVTGLYFEVWSRPGYEEMERLKRNGEFFQWKQEEPIEGQRTLFDYLRGED